MRIIGRGAHLRIGDEQVALVELVQLARSSGRVLFSGSTTQAEYGDGC